MICVCDSKDACGGAAGLLFAHCEPVSESFSAPENMSAYNGGHHLFDCCDNCASPENITGAAAAGDKFNSILFSLPFCLKAALITKSSFVTALSSNRDPPGNLSYRLDRVYLQKRVLLI